MRRGSQIIIPTKSRIEALEAKVNHLLDECDASNGKCISTEPSGCEDLYEKASSTMPMVSRNSDISMLDKDRTVNGTPARISGTDVIAAGLLLCKRPSLSKIHLR